MGKQRTTSSTDILETVKRGSVGDPDQYLKASDFYVSPDLNNEDFYPNKDQKLQVGESPSKYFGGGIPIFVGQGSLYPAVPAAKRQQALDQAALKAKMYNMAVDEKKKTSAKSELDKNEYKDTHYMYNEDLYGKFQDVNNQFRDIALNQTGNQAAADQMLANPYSPLGRQYKEELGKIRLQGNTIDQAMKDVDKIQAAKREGKFVPLGTQQSAEKLLSGNLYNDNTDEILKDISNLNIQDNLQNDLESFVGRFTPNETAGGLKYVDHKNVRPEAVGFVDYADQAGLKQSLIARLGARKDATNEQLVNLLTEQTVRYHGTQNNPRERKDSDDPSKQRRFKWDKGEQPAPNVVGGVIADDTEAIKTADAAKRGKGNEKGTPIAGMQIAVTTEGKPLVAGEGYSFQYLPTSGEGNPDKTWSYSYSIDPQTGKVDESGGEDTGYLRGVFPVNNPKTGKVEPMVVITQPAHNDRGEFGDVTRVPEKSKFIPYGENATEVYNHTVDKHGENGFKLSDSDKEGMRSMNGDKKSETQQKSSIPKDGDERAVQGGTAIFKNGKWQMK